MAENAVLKFLKKYGIGEKGVVQRMQETNPYLAYIAPGGGMMRGEPMTAEIMAAKRAYHARPENVVTMSAPNQWRDDGMGGYSQGGLFDYVAPPATEPTPEDPNMRGGFYGTGEIPQEEPQSGYTTQMPRPEYNQPAMSAPVSAVPVRPNPDMDSTLNSLMARMEGYYNAPSSDVYGYIDDLLAPANRNIQTYARPTYSSRQPSPYDMAVPGYTGGLFRPPAQSVRPDISSPTVVPVEPQDVGSAYRVNQPTEEELDALFERIIPK